MSTRGQAALETVILLTVVVTALTAMLVYVQRGIQGGLYNAGSSLGAQFDPRDPWTETHGINGSDTVTQVVVGGSVGVDILDGWLPAGPNALARLNNLPAAPVFREPGVQQNAVTANWTSNESASYCNDQGGGC